MKQFITEKGYNELIEKLNYLKITRRQEIKESLKYATDLGDLRENAEYDAALMEYNDIETQIYKIEKSLVNIEIINNKDNFKVNIGSTVLVKYDDDTTETFHIVGPDEVDSINNKISYLSPFGMQILDKKINDKIKIEFNDINYYIEILEIL